MLQIKNFLIKREQSQARLSFAKREKSRLLAKTILTLVALLALTTGAWADETKVTIDASDYDEISTATSFSKEKDGITIAFSSAKKLTSYFELQSGTTVTITSTVGKIKSVVFPCPAMGTAKYGPGCLGSPTAGQYSYNDFTGTWTGDAESFTLTSTNKVRFEKIDVTVGEADAPASGPEVAWDKTTKTGTFTMPGGNVTLEPEYYPQAVLTTQPTAINDVPATTDGAIVEAGTVANIGETTTAQGTVMYYVSPTALDDAALLALAADQWTADVPTAADLAQGQAYIYYYVRGNDSDNDEENFSDGDILAANALTVTIAAEPTYAVTFADGVNPEPPAEPEWTASPATDVKKGTEVTVTYTGTKKVIGVKAEKSDGSKRLDESTVGMIVCTNGKAYPVNMKDNLPSGVTAVGIVAYKNGKNGLVMALTDEATNMNWDTANGNNGAKAHTPAVEGYSWKVLTIGEWQYNIFSGAGVGNLAGLSTYMTAAGGTGLQNGCYWTSTPKNNSYYARCIKIENGSINFSPGADAELKSNGYHVRAFFAF